MNRIILISFLFLNLIFTTILKSSYSYEIWTPPWHNDKLENIYNIQRTENPFIFNVPRVKNFSLENEAMRFCKNQIQMIGDIKKLTYGYQCNYYEQINLSDIVPPKDKVFWMDSKLQYALYISLIKNYDSMCMIEKNKFYITRTGDFLNKEEIMKKGGPEAEIIKSEWTADPNGKKLLYATYRKPVDLLGEARIYYEAIKFSEKYLIPNNISDYKCLGPGGLSQMVSEGIKAPGQHALIDYLNINIKGSGAKGSSVNYFISDEDNGLDHEYLRRFILSLGMNIKVRKDSQVLVTNNDNNIFAWKANPREYYQVSSVDNVVLEAYLKKFPSILPRDYKVDEKAWKSKEVEMCINRMREDATQKEDKDNKYMKDYIYLVRFIEPILGAPLAPPWKVKLTVEDRLRHFEVISKWWEKNKDKVMLRPGRPLSHEEVLHLIPESNMESAEVALKKFKEAIKGNSK